MTNKLNMITNYVTITTLLLNAYSHHSYTRLVHDANLDSTIWRLGRAVETELDCTGLKQNGLAGSDEMIQLSIANPGCMGVPFASIPLGGGVVLS